MRRALILVVLCAGCAVPVETTVDEPYTYEDEPGQPPGGYERPPEPNPCGYAGVKGWVKIPIECYQGPPRFDDVEDVIRPPSQGQADALSQPAQSQHSDHEAAE